MSKFLPNLRSITSKVAGFTMIELLIVITILGILATAVLSAINPIEQINRGRDTGKRSDSEQLLSALERYNAFAGHPAWVLDANEPQTSYVLTSNDADTGVPIKISLLSSFQTTTGVAGSTLCNVLERLGSSTPTLNAASCTATNEVKSSFVTRLVSPNEKKLYVYNKGGVGDSTYVCFAPQSTAFKDEATKRCAGLPGAGLPDDIGANGKAFICNGTTNTELTPLICLP